MGGLVTADVSEHRFWGILERIFSLHFFYVDWSIIMKTDQRPKYFLYVRAFENAKWIFTDKKSGEVSEYNYSEMSKLVEDRYISWYNNSHLVKPPYNQEKLNPQNVIVRYLHQVACGIYREGYVEGIRYSEILPDYTIDCYDWRYQCKHCESVLDEIRGKGQAKVNRLYCVSCRRHSEYK